MKYVHLSSIVAVFFSICLGWRDSENGAAVAVGKPKSAASGCLRPFRYAFAGFPWLSGRQTVGQGVLVPGSGAEGNATGAVPFRVSRSVGIGEATPGTGSEGPATARAVNLSARPVVLFAKPIDTSARPIVKSERVPVAAPGGRRAGDGSRCRRKTEERKLLFTDMRFAAAE